MRYRQRGVSVGYNDLFTIRCRAKGEVGRAWRNVEKYRPILVGKVRFSDCRLSIIRYEMNTSTVNRNLQLKRIK